MRTHARARAQDNDIVLVGLGSMIAVIQWTGVFRPMRNKYMVEFGATHWAFVRKNRDKR
jgi:hypothetical protein